MDDQNLVDNFYQTVDMFIKLLGAEQVSRTDIFFRISRAAIGTNIDYSEIQRVVADITSFSAWYDAWAKSAQRFALIAADAEAAGHTVTAGENYLRSALLYHYAQLFTRPEDPRRSEGQRNRVANYRKACPYLDPVIEMVKVPHQGLSFPGYLRLPTGVKSPPVVVMIPGANSVKEELHQWGYEFVQRGIATLAADGPGQGECSLRNGGVALSLETFSSAVTSIIDYLESRKDIDSKRLALWGQSTGGHLVIRAAASEKRVRCVVSLGGGYDFRLEITSTTPADVWEEARDLYGLASFDEAERYVRQHGTLKGVIDKVTCPLLVIHGAKDNIVAMEEIELIQRQVSGPIKVLVYEDGNHSVCNRNLEMRAVMADWVVDQMGSL